jgi:hypothetical protein
MQALPGVRLRRWRAGAATVIVALAACGDDAELGVRASLAPPVTLDMLDVTLEIGDRRTRWTGANFQADASQAQPHTGVVDTPTRGEATVRFTLRDGPTLVSQGAVTIPLQSDWRWRVDLIQQTTDPEGACFGCIGSQAFPLAPAYRATGRDSLWVVWGGNSISDPVIY